jgi:hypothetical protein
MSREACRLPTVIISICTETGWARANPSASACRPAWQR